MRFATPIALLVCSTAALAGSEAGAKSTTIEELQEMIAKHGGAGLEMTRFGDTKLVMAMPRDASDPAVANRLDVRVTCEFQDTPFAETVEFLRQASGVNMVVAPSVLAKAPMVTLKVQAMKLSNLLNWLKQQTGVGYEIGNQAVYFTDQPSQAAKRIVVLDVADLVMPIPDFPGKELAYNSGQGGGFSLFAPKP